jgi:hypothetical protein
VGRDLPREQSAAEIPGEVGRPEIRFADGENRYAAISAGISGI